MGSALRSGVGTLARQVWVAGLLAFASCGSGAPACADAGLGAGSSGGNAPAAQPANAPAAEPGGPSVAGPPVACEPTTTELQVCGRTESITEGCVQPVVTPEMSAAAADHPELKDEYQRMNACLASDPTCPPEADQLGDESVAEDLAAYNVVQADAAGKLRFHQSVTSATPVGNARDDLATAVHKGFSRDPAGQQMLFRADSHQKFHDNAEGVALVQKTLADRERAALEQQAAVLGEMAQQFSAAGDTVSAANTTLFQTIAKNRALALEGVSCELARLATVDQSRVVGQHSLGPGDAAGADPGESSPGGTATGTASDVTGVGLRTAMAVSTATASASATGTATSTVTSALADARPPSFENDEIVMRIYGPDPGQRAGVARDSVNSLIGAPSPDDSLFVRVHRELQVQQALGRFQKSLLD